MLEIFMILSNFKPKKSPFWPFLLEKLSKMHKIGEFGCKNLQNLKEIQEEETYWTQNQVQEYLKKAFQIELTSIQKPDFYKLSL